MSESGINTSLRRVTIKEETHFPEGPFCSNKSDLELTSRKNHSNISKVGENTSQLDGNPHGKCMLIEGT